MEVIDPTEQNVGGKKEGPDFGQLLLEHIRNILKIGCKEMRGGYWTYRPTTVNGEKQYIEEYVPDAREEFASAVDTLSAAMRMTFMEDEDIEAEDNVLEEIKETSEYYTQSAEQIDKRIDLDEETAQQLADDFKTHRHRLKLKQFRILAARLYDDVGKVEEFHGTDD
jgi:hypothetical protein